MQITAFDHIVLTARAVEATCDFYTRVLSFRRITFGGGRAAPTFGDQDFNLHQLGRSFAPAAAVPTSGSADLCFERELAQRRSWHGWRSSACR